MLATFIAFTGLVMVNPIDAKDRLYRTFGAAVAVGLVVGLLVAYAIRASRSA